MEIVILGPRVARIVVWLKKGKGQPNEVFEPVNIK